MRIFRGITCVSFFFFSVFHMRTCENNPASDSGPTSCTHTPPPAPGCVGRPPPAWSSIGTPDGDMVPRGCRGQRGTQCVLCVYVYDVPPQPLPNTEAFEVWGRKSWRAPLRLEGTKSSDWSTVRLESHTLGRVAFEQLRSSPCRVTSPSEAGLFLIPETICAYEITRAKKKKLLPWLSASTAPRHVMFRSHLYDTATGDVTGTRNCRGWFGAGWGGGGFNGTGQLWPSDRPSLHKFFAEKVPQTEQQWPPVSVRVPHPSLLSNRRVTPSTRAKEPGPWMKKRARPTLVVFITDRGRPVVNGHQELRDVLSRQCASSPACDIVDLAALGSGSEDGTDPAAVLRASSRANQVILAAYARSRFCLHPPGDACSRKGILDALLVGCIPVLFHECQRPSELLPWHWGPWQRDSSIWINGRGLLAGRINVTDTLQNVSGADEDAMRASIARNGHRLVYSLQGHARGLEDDALSITLRNVAKDVHQRRRGAMKSPCSAWHLPTPSSTAASAPLPPMRLYYRSISPKRVEALESALHSQGLQAVRVPAVQLLEKGSPLFGPRVQVTADARDGFNNDSVYCRKRLRHEDTSASRRDDPLCTGQTPLCCTIPWWDAGVQKDARIRTKFDFPSIFLNRTDCRHIDVYSHSQTVDASPRFCLGSPGNWLSLMRMLKRVEADAQKAKPFFAVLLEDDAHPVPLWQDAWRHFFHLHSPCNWDIARLSRVVPGRFQGNAALLLHSSYAASFHKLLAHEPIGSVDVWLTELVLQRGARARANMPTPRVMHSRLPVFTPSGDLQTSFLAIAEGKPER